MSPSERTTKNSNKSKKNNNSDVSKNISNGNYTTAREARVVTTACRKKEKNNRITDSNKTITNTNSLTRVKVTPVIHNNENANNQARDRFMEVLDNIPSIPINPNVFFSTTLAKGAKIIPCIGDGNCWYDGMVKGCTLLGDNKGSHVDFRRDYSAWALCHPDFYISEGLTVQMATVMGNNIPATKQTEMFQNMWNSVKIPKTYTDEFALKISPAYLKAELWIWQRTTTSSHDLRLVQRFTAYEDTPTRQIHLILDGEANSSTGSDGHYSLISSYSYENSNGIHITVNAASPDRRFVDPSATSPQQQPTTQATHPNRKILRDRCSEEDCARAACDAAIRQHRKLCTPCLAKITALCQLCEIIPATDGSTICAECHGAGDDDDDRAESGGANGTIGGENNYAMAWTDGGRRDVKFREATKRKGTTVLKDVGGWAFLLLCGRGHKFVASGCLGPNSTNNIGEFRAIKEVMIKAVAANITQLDINTDSMIAVQYYEGTCARDTDHLAQIFREIEEIAVTNQVQFRLNHVKAHAQDLNNQMVDSMCTAVILAVDMDPRHEGPKTIKPFEAPNPCARPRNTANAQARYQTFSPYNPLDDRYTPTRGVPDLSDDRGNVLFICPLCDPIQPNLLKDRRSLLTHLRGQHHSQGATMIDGPVKELFGIAHCHLCELYYSKTTIKSHNCKPGAVQPLRQRHTNPTPVLPVPVQTRKPSTGNSMLRPSEISPELVDRLTDISYDSIFSTQACTIEELHHNSVNMWASVVALLLEGIVLYAYGGVHGAENECMAEAFLKLFLLAPRLILSSRRGVADRARALLTGTVESFNFLYELTQLPRKQSKTKSPDLQAKNLAIRVSKLVENCDLSRAINLLMNVPPPVITPDLIEKIRALHPQAPPEHQIPDTAPTRIIIGPDDELFSEATLAKIMKDLRRDAAPDTTGLRANHLKCIFRGKREQGSPEMRSRYALFRLLHKTLEDPDRLGPIAFWRHFCGGKLSVITAKARPVGQKNLLLKILQSINDRAYNKEFLHLAGPAHLAGKKNGVMAAALMALMEVDYAQHVVEEDPSQIRCILTTDAKAAFQSASRKHCYEVICTDAKLKERFAPFFAKTHKGSQKITWLAGKTAFEPSSGFTQGDINASKLYTCNTAGLVSGLQAASPIDGVVFAIVDDITLMGTLDSIVDMEASRAELQKAPNYLVNPLKQHVYTINEDHVPEIKLRLPSHDVFYIGDAVGFQLSGIPVGGETFIRRKLQENLDSTKNVIAAIVNKLSSTQEKLLLLLQCIPGRIQHMLAAITPSISREFAQQHDEALRDAVAKVLELGVLTDRDKLLMQRKISDHGLGMRSMERNLEFLFLAGFMRTAGTIQKSFPHFTAVLQHTLSGESGYGRELTEALQGLRDIHYGPLNKLLPLTLAEAILESYEWPHDAIQRELDHMLSVDHDALYDMTKIPDQQDKATMISTDTTIFLLVPRSAQLRMPNNHLTYLAKQLFGKAQRTNTRKFCPNVSQSTGTTCGIVLDCRDIHIRTCRMNNINHVKHAVVQAWFQDLAKQAHIATTAAPPISTVSPRNPTKQLAGDLLLVDVSLQDKGKDGGCCVIDFSIVTPAAESHCQQASITPLHTAKLREEEKINKYAHEYKAQGNIYFEPFVIESGGVFGECAKKVFSKICNIITQQTGQSSSNIAYYWKSRLLVVLAKITHANVLKWARAHNVCHDPTSGAPDMYDCYENSSMEDIRRMSHSGADQRVNFLSNNIIFPQPQTN